MFIERAPRLIRPLNYPPGTPGRGAAHDRRQERRARAGDQRDGPHLHGPAGRSVRRGRARARRLSARSPAPTPSSSTCIARRPARSRRWAISPTAAPASWSARTPMCRPSDHRILPGGTAFMSDVGMTGDYEFDHRHGQGRAADALHAQDSVGPVRAGRRARHVVRRRGRNRRRDGPGRPDRRGAPRRRLEEARPAFWD